MVDITFYDSDEEMWEHEAKARKLADERVNPWHLKVRAGDILVSDPGYGFPIFHEVLDNEKIVGDNFKKYGDDYEDEGVYILDTYCFNPEPWNYRFCRSYSEVCPNGELGDIHLSIALGKIPRDIFEDIRDNGYRFPGDDID